ncbi:cell wall hydrolase [Marivivens niveibacter]|uniref:Cell wall hydrolase n=2 Tax=Marivivens niveibacter TaxID=1930667 RepID=A0A251X1Z4_9RHOB|nr:cell wall hydrolase [Marivivens niveibacter]
MLHSFVTKMTKTAAAVLCFVSAGTFVSAQDLTSVRLSSLLGEFSTEVQEIPSVQLAFLTTIPSPADRDIQTVPRDLYDREKIAAMPEATGGSQWECLAEALYFEARGESVRGMFAVGEVILNRVDSARFPDTVCDVVNQGTGRRYACQFTYTCDGHAEVISEPRAWERVGKIARLLIDGAPRELTNGATHYHTRAVNPSWARVFTRTAAIDSHLFYRQPVRTASNG